MEDFVPYELAVKLKEKGFNEDCYTVYNTATMRIERSLTTWKDYKGVILAPTISQVLKWLREENIHLYIDIDNEGWFFEIKCLKTRFMVNTDFFKRYSTHELAALAGVEYCLDNLI
jgi:hypothetical protein